MGHLRRALLACAAVAVFAVAVFTPLAFAQDAAASEALGREVVTFERMVELAVTSSAVSVEEARVGLARRELAASGYPVAASASGEVRSRTGFGGQGTDLELDLAVNAGFRVGWGATAEAEAAAERSLAAALDAVEAARTNAVMQAVRLFAEVRGAALAREGAQIGWRIASLQAEAARSRYAAGAVLAVDVAQAELNERAAELDLRAAEANYAALLAELSLLIGSEVGEVAGDVPAGLLAADPGAVALAARIDVRAAMRDLEAAAAALAQVGRASGVNVTANASLSGSVGSTSLSLGASIDTRDLTPSVNGRVSATTAPPRPGVGAGVSAVVGVGASVPLGPPDTRVAAAELAYMQAEARLAEVLARAGLEVETLAGRAEISAARLELAESCSVLAQDAYEAEQARFELGAVGVLEVLRAEAAAVTAAGGVQSARANYLLDLMALAVASGRSVMEVLR